MTTSTAPDPTPFPARLLLATDLSARCDRALDRAAQLAGQWQAGLLVGHVLDPAAHPDQALAWAAGTGAGDALRIARQQLARDLAGLPVQADMQIAKSKDVAAGIRDMADAAGADLVVTGVARFELLGRFLLGSSVERLARSLPQPLLVVRNRPHGPYREIVVACDFSPASRDALRCAARLFPGQELTVFHAYQQPYSGMADTAPPARGIPQAEQDACAAFLADSKLPASTRVRPVILRGALELLLTQHVRRHEADLVVMGAQGRGALASALLGSTAARLLDCLPCDALVVHRPRAAAD
ncbi:universal stress protein [Cupriavidus sp. USMAA2-4]|uniref:Universal stress protein n=1 Tax=Cupriavidus malaysiensis TaxID=367825 RepID=A0ABM6F7I1_9BURK|nr:MULTISPECIES: universal stress protein [Cupriavidus]AOY92807.1 universal stress protein [Cupriavidus sp. USMAA2-4]AOZ00724.1 universal stress protein [Cupriavidus sp. USMAHM13]AOZ07481.1 universal stress protein [Cupriavidus malaysiensis]